MQRHTSDLPCPRGCPMCQPAWRRLIWICIRKGSIKNVPSRPMQSQSPPDSSLVLTVSCSLRSARMSIRAHTLFSCDFVVALNRPSGASRRSQLPRTIQNRDSHTHSTRPDKPVRVTRKPLYKLQYPLSDQTCVCHRSACPTVLVQTWRNLPKRVASNLFLVPGTFIFPRVFRKKQSEFRDLHERK